MTSRDSIENCKKDKRRKEDVRIWIRKRGDSQSLWWKRLQRHLTLKHTRQRWKHRVLKGRKDDSFCCSCTSNISHPPSSLPLLQSNAKSNSDRSKREEFEYNHRLPSEKIYPLQRDSDPQNPMVIWNRELFFLFAVLVCLIGANNKLAVKWKKMSTYKGSHPSERM